MAAGYYAKLYDIEVLQDYYAHKKKYEKINIKHFIITFDRMLRASRSC